MKKILVLNRSAVGRHMGSPGIRAYHIARILAEQMPDAQVTLTGFLTSEEPDALSPQPNLKIVRHRNAISSLRMIQQHDIIVSRNFPPYMLPVFLKKRLALDFYTAFFAEWMEFSYRFDSLGKRVRWMEANRRYLDLQLTLADYILCSNERQRDVWLANLSSLGLITPQSYDRDRTLRRLVGVVPYGVQPGFPEHTRQVIKGVVPGIGEHDKVVIWNGSIVEWFDAPTVIRAMAEVARVRDDVKLFFLGTNHPDAVTHIDAPPVQEAIALSKELGLYERSVFFNTGWVPYDEIGSYLAEADIGVCAGFDNLEARYAHRTRFVDLFRAQLPIICTSGEEISDRIERDPLGITVASGDASAFAAAILRMVDDDELYARCRANLAVLKEELRWDRVLAPLVEFCQSDGSVAVSKRQRFLPLVWRTISYMLRKAVAPQF